MVDETISHYRICARIGAGGLAEVELFCWSERTGSPRVKSRVEIKALNAESRH
jgi:hypothetical protein